MVFASDSKVTTFKTNKAPADAQDNQSTATIPSGRLHAAMVAKLVEIFPRYEITSKTRDHDDRGPHLCHAAVIYHMYNTFLEDELQIINNHNKWIQLPNYQKWADAKHHKKPFDIHTIPGKGGKPDRHYVVHRIRTTLLLSAIQNDHNMF